MYRHSLADASTNQIKLAVKTEPIIAHTVAAGRSRKSLFYAVYVVMFPSKAARNPISKRLNALGSL